ncbi:MAG TPA: hypothetical protein VF210_02635 [Pseudomonadales bacterium]
MPVMKHPLTGAIYTLRDDGLVEVDNNGKRGVFHYDGRYCSGELRQADPHFLLWLAGPQLPEGAARRHRG